jgi:hypothetical protein
MPKKLTDADRVRAAMKAAGFKTKTRVGDVALKRNVNVSDRSCNPYIQLTLPLAADINKAPLEQQHKLHDELVKQFGDRYAFGMFRRPHPRLSTYLQFYVTREKKQ